ncbi:MAG: hypothetical protein AAGH88_11110 [Planctomycetota bacterium]
MKRFLTALVVSAFAIVGSTANAGQTTPTTTLPLVPVVEPCAVGEAAPGDPFENSAHRDAARNLWYGWRTSEWFDYKSWVLVVRNRSNRSVDVTVRCYDRNGNTKDIFVSVMAGRSAEIGWVQGWQGNWVIGERAEVYYDGELIRRLDGPREGKR